LLESKLPLGGVGGVGGAGGVGPSGRPESNKPGAAGESTFGNVLDNKVGNSPGAQGLSSLTGANGVGPAANSKIEGLRFSAHALERMQSRGISFKPEDLSKLGSAVDKAAAKGSKNALMLMGDNALIVSVKNRTVVTAMDREAMKDNVFTNIDSTVIL
jgi:flagellar operon protein